MGGLHINALVCNPPIVTQVRGELLIEGHVYLYLYKRVHQICMKHYQNDFVDTTTSYN